MTENKEEYWSRFACTYDNDQEYVIGKAILHIITSKLREERELGEVIEFGCGVGYFTKVIAKDARHVIATDLSDEMLEMAKIYLQEFHNITIQKADGEDTYFPSRRFDTYSRESHKGFTRKPSNLKKWRIIAYGKFHRLRYELV
jgi:protein-L-isoaspartate O-methyltransferase